MMLHIEVLRRFLGIQGVYVLLVKIQIVTLIIHLGWLYLFISVLDMGLYGIAICGNITSSTIFLSSVAYISLRPNSVKPN